MDVVAGPMVARVAAQNSSLQLHIQAKLWAGIIAGKHRPFPPNAFTVDAEAPGRKSKQSASSLTVTLLHQIQRPIALILHMTLATGTVSPNLIWNIGI